VSAPNFHLSQEKLCLPENKKQNRTEESLLQITLEYTLSKQKQPFSGNCPPRKIKGFLLRVQLT